MAKVMNWIIIWIGISILLAFAGVNNISNNTMKIFGIGFTTNSTTNQVIDLNLNDSTTHPTLEDMTENKNEPKSDLLLRYGLLFALGAILTVYFTLGGRISTSWGSIQVTESQAISLVVGVMVLFCALDMFSVISAMSSYSMPWLTFLTAAIILPLMCGMIIAFISFWRGSDI